MNRQGTHAIALDRKQIEAIRHQLDRALAEQSLTTLFLVATDDPEVIMWFRWTEQGVPTLAIGDPEFDSIFRGEIYTLGVDFELTDENLRKLGLMI